jgi:hypothetical protein
MLAHGHAGYLSDEDLANGQVAAAGLSVPVETPLNPREGWPSQPATYVLE